MTLRNANENLATQSGQLSEKELLEGVLLVLAAMLEKMPRLDGADRMVITGSEQPQAVSTVSTVSNQTNIGGRDASQVAYGIANMGCAHIYNQIKVS